MSLSPLTGRGERYEKIQSLLEQVIRKRGAGQSLDDDALIRQNPDLMPELAESLRALATLRAASHRAGEPQPTGPPSDQNENPLDEDLRLISEHLSSYHALERIRHGGQGIVYRALHGPTNRTVAVKVLLNGPFASDRERHRFAREADIISRMRHPNIVTLYDSGTVRGLLYYIMEFIDGLEIDDFVILHDLTTEQIVRLFVTVCRAVGYAHQQGVVHRDLKPSNILVDPQGQPHVLDFGLAKDFREDRSASISLSGQLFGTLPYLSPEQVGGDSDEIDVRSDIYSLAVVLYELLTGRTPFAEAKDVVSLRASILAEDPPALRRALVTNSSDREPAARFINSDLEAIVCKALSREKARRYQSAAAFADDLERYLAGDAVEAKAASRAYLLRKTVRRYRLQAAVASAFGLTLVASLIVVSMSWLETRAERDRARQAARLAQATLNDVVTVIEEGVRPLAGGVAVRDRLLGGVGDRLAALTSLVGSQSAVSDVLAASWEKQGDIAWAQGHHALAAEHYQAFLSICRKQAEEGRPPGGEDRRALIRGLRKLGGVSPEPQQQFERAVRVGESALQETPHDDQARLELCKTYNAWAEWHFLAGRLQEAGRLIDSCLKRALPPESASERDGQWGELLAQAYAYRGRILVQLGQGEAGMDWIGRSIQLRERLAELESTNVERRLSLMTSYRLLGDLHRDGGRTEQAVELYEKGVNVGRYLVAADPTVAAWKQDLYGLYDRLARLELDAGHTDRAEGFLAHAIPLAEGLVQAEPDNDRWLRILAFSYRLRGRVWHRKNDWQQARQDFEMARRTYEAMAQSGACDPAVQGELAQVYTSLARCCEAGGDAERARECFLQASRIYSALFEKQPALTERALDLVSADNNLAVWHLARRTPEDDAIAGGLLERAASLLEELEREKRLTTQQGRKAEYEAAVASNRGIIAHRAAERAGGGIVSAPPTSRPAF